MMTEKSDYSRQERWNRARRDQGLTRVGVWVPVRDTEKLREYAAELRQKWAFEREQERGASAGQADN